MFPTIDPIKTGENIKKIVKNNGYTAVTVAKMLGLADKSTVYKWMRGDVLPDIANMVAMAVMLGVKLDDMVAVAA